MRWLPVVGFEGIYEVSEYGDCRRIVSGPGVRPGRVLNPITDKGNPHAYYRLSFGGRSEKRKAHRMVLEAFVGPGEGKWALHADDDKSNNHVSNLRWGTPAENSADRKRNNGGWHNGWNARTHCPSGHEYTPVNTYLAPDLRPGRTVSRKCRECRRNQSRRPAKAA